MPIPPQSGAELEPSQNYDDTVSDAKANRARLRFPVNRVVRQWEVVSYDLFTAAQRTNYTRTILCLLSNDRRATIFDGI